MTAARLHSREQHPVDVARACVAVAVRAVRSEPQTRLDALRVLGRAGLATRVGGVGEWVPSALARWARGVVFVREPGAIGERVLTPARTLELGQGDCDDVAAAVCAWALAVGLRAGVVWRWTGERLAHICAVVAGDWEGSPPSWVVDPERGLSRLEGSEWQWGHVLEAEL